MGCNLLKLLIAGLVAGFATTALAGTSDGPAEFDFSRNLPQNGIFLKGSAHALGNRRISGGALSCDITGGDPFFSIVPVERPLKEADRFAVEMAYEGAPGKMQFFYNLGDKGGYAVQAVIPDGKFHTYTFRLDREPKLKEAGTLKNFRFDPVHPGAKGGKLKIRSLRLFAVDGRPRLPLQSTVPPAGAGELQVDGFLQVNRGGKAAAATRLALDYDEQELRIRFSTSLDNVKYTANHRKPDSPVYLDDSLEFMFQTAPDRYYQVAINPVNAVFDAAFTMENGAPDMSDAGWDSRAKLISEIQPGVWSGELRIPFAALGLAGIPKTPWKVNVVRNSIADGKGVSSWNRYNGRNHQLDTFRELVFERAPSPRAALTGPGNLYPGSNRAVFANPDRAAMTAAVRLRNLENGKEEEFSATGSGPEVAVPYRISEPGNYQMIATAGNGTGNWFADSFEFQSADLGKELAAALESLRGDATKTEDGTLAERRKTLSAAGDALARELKQSGQMNIRDWERFKAESGELLAALQFERLKQATRRNFPGADLPFAVAGADSMVKIFRSLGPGYPPFEGEAVNSLALEAAGNETEGTQLLLIGLDDPVEITGITASGLAGPNGALPASRINISTVNYIDTTGMQTNYPVEFRGEWPEMLLPGAPEQLLPHTISAVWIKVSVPAGTPPGEYRGTITVDAKGVSPLSIPLTVTVWNFSLPATPSLRTAISTDWRNPVDYYGKLLPAGKLDEEQRRTVLDNLARFQLENRMSPTYIYDWTCYSGKPIPYPLPDRYAEYMKAGLNAVAVANLTPGDFGSSGADLRNWYDAANRQQFLNESIRKNYDLAAQGGAASRLYLHAFDEVFAHKDAAAKAAVLRDLVTFWRKTTPEIKVECITYVLPELIGIVDIWCPSFTMMDKEYAKYQQRREAGDELWLYTCLGSPAPGNPPSFVLESKAIDLRMVGWLCRKFHASGFLYYEISCWKYNYPKDGRCWPELPWHPVKEPGYNGEATLIYPARSWKEEPVSSIRFENLRDGFEDYDYLTLLEQCWKNGGSSHASAEEKQEVETILSAGDMVKTAGFYNRDDRQLRRQRRRIARLIEKFSNTQ